MARPFSSLQSWTVSADARGGSWGNISGNGNAAGMSESVGGFLVGVDMPVYDWRVGYFGGFSRTDFSVKARNSSGNSNNYHLGMYGGTQWGDLGCGWVPVIAGTTLRPIGT
jgi:outer membrane autotransporter protein